MKNSPLIKVILREFERIVDNKVYFIISIFLPIFLFVFISSIYINGVVRGIPVAVCDEDHSALSETYSRYIESTGTLKIVKYIATREEMKKEFLDGKISGCFCIPKDMEADIKKGKEVTVTIYNNTTNLVTGSNLLKEVTTVTKTFSGGVLLKKIRLKGMMEEQATDIINPIHVVSQSMYNANYNYLDYLVPGLVPALFQMVIMLIASLIFSSEFSAGTYGDLLRTANNNIFTMVLGKSIPHLLLHIATSLGVIGILYPFFNASFDGSVFLTLLFFFLFILASFCFGMAISTVTKNLFFATEAALFINTPAFLFSGFVYPLWAMPKIHSTYALIMPFTHFMNGYLKIAVMNTPLSNVCNEIIGLSVFVVIPLAFTFVVLWIRKKRLLKNHGVEEILYNEL
jgi:ABC-2 type transport system permease protein